MPCVPQELPCSLSLTFLPFLLHPLSSRWSTGGPAPHTRPTSLRTTLPQLSSCITSSREPPVLPSLGETLFVSAPLGELLDHEVRTFKSCLPAIGSQPSYCHSLPQFPHLYKGDKDSSCLVVPSHLKAFTFGSCSLNTFLPPTSVFPRYLEKSAPMPVKGGERGRPVQQQPYHSTVSPQSSSVALTLSRLTGPPRSSHEFLWSPQICHPLSRQGPLLSSQPDQTTA